MNSSNPITRKLFDKEMVLAMLASPVFRKGLLDTLDDPALVDKPFLSLSDAELNDIETSCLIIFRKVSPTIFMASNPAKNDGLVFDDSLPEVFGCDGVFAIWDAMGWGFSEEWFSSAEDAKAFAESKWPDLTFMAV